MRAHWNAATDSSKGSAGDRKWHMGFCLGCAPLSKGMIGTWARCNKFPSWMRQKGPGSREYWVAPFREGIQLYPSTFPHYPSLHLVMQNGNGTGKSGELCLNPRVRSMHGDMYQVVLLNFLNVSLIKNVWEIQPYNPHHVNTVKPKHSFKVSVNTSTVRYNLCSWCYESVICMLWYCNI